MYFSEPEDDGEEDGEEPGRAEDEAEWRHEITMLRKEVGKALGEVDDARSAAAAAESEVDFLRQSITGSPPGSPGVTDRHGARPSRLGSFTQKSAKPASHETLLAELRRTVDALPDVASLSPPPAAVSSSLPSLEAPAMTNAELRVAELERSLRIMQVRLWYRLQRVPALCDCTLACVSLYGKTRCLSSCVTVWVVVGEGG